jgi:hypothetical protein
MPSNLIRPTMTSHLGQRPPGGGSCSLIGKAATSMAAQQELVDSGLPIVGRGQPSSVPDTVPRLQGGPGAGDEGGQTSPA